jgi:hypothetical protein
MDFIQFELKKTISLEGIAPLLSFKLIDESVVHSAGISRLHIGPSNSYVSFAFEHSDEVFVSAFTALSVEAGEASRFSEEPSAGLDPADLAA